jgi:hypothetical protein
MSNFYTYRFMNNTELLLHGSLIGLAPRHARGLTICIMSQQHTTMPLNSTDKSGWHTTNTTVSYDMHV